VPCERIFSSGGETSTERRNRLGPQLLEALQVLKFQLRQEHLTFTDELVAREEDYQIEIVGGVSDHAIKELIAAQRIDELKELIANAKES
ncbi:hypothetical protein BXZ70DRAFT_868027, partial [Cristinia sonorae]